MLDVVAVDLSLLAADTLRWNQFNKYEFKKKKIEYN